MQPTRIFVSSVQKEFASERQAIRAAVESDAVLGRYFQVFLFEELPASDRKVGEVFVSEVDRCDVYVLLIGTAYGFEDAEGVSPTEREFDRATLGGKHRLLFVAAGDDAQRHPKAAALLVKAGLQLIRRRFTDVDDLRMQLARSLADWLAARGLIQERVFEDRACTDATVADLDVTRLADFVRRARAERQFGLAEGTPVSDVLEHLHLQRDGHPTQAAVMLFGRDPQRFLPVAEVRCMHFHGTQVERPVPFYRVFKGPLFDQVDHATDFVLAVLNRSVGTRAVSNQVPVVYEIPPDVVREAVVNAVAHRDYSSGAAVQVSVFADRLEVRNPGQLPAPLTPERLREPHGSVARNPRICEALFLARYIEKFGTGTLMMIRLCRSQGLPEPVFAQQGGDFVVTVWRDWLTEAELARLVLNDRQRLALIEIRLRERLVNFDYQQLTRTSRKTAARDLGDLVTRGVLVRVGTGRGTHYVLASKRDNNGTNEPIQGALRSDATVPERDKNGTNGTPRRSAGKGKPGAKR